MSSKTEFAGPNREGLLAGSRLSLQYAKQDSERVYDSAGASTWIRSSIRSIAFALNQAGATLKEIGTTQAELKTFLDPNSTLTPEEKDKLWKWVTEGEPSEKLTPMPELREE